MDVNATSSSVLSQLSSSRASEEAKSNELGKDEFLTLLVTQMNNQNPLEPQDNGEFIAQLAQFSSLEGIDNLNDTVDGFVSSYQSSAALEATALVGRQVQVRTDTAWMQEGEAFRGVVELPVSSPEVKVSIYDSAGQLVRNVDLGSQTAGNHDLVWDGLNNDGEALPSGLYTVKAEARFDGEMYQVSTLLGANVNSVTLGSAGSSPTLNLAGLGKVSLDDVQTIMQ
ncbi:flagellar hook assembly protein FlgD [Aestuariicella sp. G3-2]|uniref:flagellar hook assembly protein FlgD n=1 Tax=Pseudomaricurvus albidus TaxID=2842452 RepID=UPI001C0B4A61|nr:flagellar hook assembly protein FlgD [Aestuariicella albida]MBU3071150.1 flagellar hook assembly protein FlgD [Aestuariicella albida]